MEGFHEAINLHCSLTALEEEGGTFFIVAHRERIWNLTDRYGKNKDLLPAVRTSNFTHDNGEW
jgi:hypothetical protein